ncbi:MAG: signal recognition particle protein [Gammaproteobacteria bacterium]|nr:signal recognition particle protein [Gammaproteobacteria bacterium]
MFSTLSNRLRGVLDQVRGRGRLTDENIQDAVRDVRRALIEADVALPVVRDFVELVRQRALGSDVLRSLTPGQVFVRIIHEELARILGDGVAELNLRHQPPAVILLAGLQGAGKTTTAAKLALFIRDRLAKRVGLVSTDTQRPAAILQLERLAASIQVPFLSADISLGPVGMADQALADARREQLEVLIVDTAGRSRLDAELLDELRAMRGKIDPIEMLFVVDSMAGQDAVNAARAFGDALPLTGVILTKTDGDARGGAALSVKSVTGQPIKFIGSGEAVTELEPFHPERMASRILGMGDVLSLVEEVQRTADHESAARLAEKVSSGKQFDMNDLRAQLQQITGLGGVEGLLQKLPLPGGMSAEKLAGQIDSRMLRRQIAVIDSMTPRERRRPVIVDGSRRRRIAAGAGLPVQEVNRLLKQHAQMQKMMKKMGQGGLRRLMRGLPGLPR